MRDDDWFGAVIVATGTVFALVMLARGYVVWSWTGTGTAAVAAAVVAATVLTLVILARRDTRKVLQGAMVARVDTHGATGPASKLQRLIGRHEVGHVVGAETTGMGVESVEIGDGYGYVRTKRFTTVDDAITFLAAGHLAVHTKRGADSDLAAIRRLAAELPAEQRKHRLHAAIGRARTATAAQAGRIRRDGHRLADTGRW